MPIDQTIREQALHWATRTGDPGFHDWEAFAQWLEQDPAHARAYDEVCAAVADAAELVSAALPANDDTVVEDAPALGRARAGWWGGALAASLALLAGLGYWQGHRHDRYSVETAAGQMQSVALGAGSRVDLAGGTRIELDRNFPRYARLERGQALFTVHHDAENPFRVMVGEDTLLDVGTVFDVRRDDGAMSVAVAEGAVQFDPDGANVRVSSGQVLRKSHAGMLALAPIAGMQVGEWREGRLTFAAASLKDVAADLTRASGLAFAAAPDSGGQAITGSILIDPVRKDPRMLGRLLGVSVRQEAGRWVIGGH